MQYDKNSFLAGIAVGRQLKGWAMGGTGGRGIILLSDITVQPQQTTFIETVPEGYDGIGSVTVLGDEDLIPANVRLGKTIFGVEGSYAPTFNLQTINQSITANGTITLRPSSGYDGIRQATVSVNVPTSINNQTKTVTPTAAQQTVRFDSNYTGLSQVIVNGDSDLVASNIRSGVNIFGVIGTYGDAALPTQTKTVTPRSYTQNVYQDSGYDLTRVTVYGDGNLSPANIRNGVTVFGVTGTFDGEPQSVILQDKTVTLNRPSSGGVNVYADAGYNALRKVHINGDANLTAANIKQGVSIFGVTGAYESPMRTLTVIPSLDRQYIVPSDEYQGFSSVTVEPVSALEPPEWEGTQAEYDALETYDPNTTYYILRTVP